MKMLVCPYDARSKQARLRDFHLSARRPGRAEPYISSFGRRAASEEALAAFAYAVADFGPPEPNRVPVHTRRG